MRRGERRTAEIACGGVAFRGVLRHRALNDVVERRRHAGLTSSTGGGGAYTWAQSVARSFSRLYGGWPVRASNRTHPSEYTSVCDVTDTPSICSGAV